jgi:hypothetical protein
MKYQLPFDIALFDQSAILTAWDDPQLVAELVSAKLRASGPSAGG